MSEPQPAHQAHEPHDDHSRDDLPSAPRDQCSSDGRDGRDGRDSRTARDGHALDGCDGHDGCDAQDAQDRSGPPRQERPRRPAALLFEPGAPAGTDCDRFFDLESMEDPRELLARATELALAFRAAAERATDFQAMAAAQLADPRRFDRLTTAALAERAGWTEDYAKRMVEYGEGLIRSGGVTP